MDRAACFKRAMGIVAVVAIGALAGCTQMIAAKIVAPPNRGQPHSREADAADGRAVKISVGPPGAVLAAWILEPASVSRGTVLILHGILADHRQVRNIAHALRNAGFTAVMVDLRGHGESTGEHLTFGVVESRDLMHVTDWLQEHGWCGKSIGVYGFSYGAATAIEYAGADPRVSTVVALAPFATLAGEAPHLGGTLLPLSGLFLSSQFYADVLTAAGKQAHFDPAAASPLSAIAHTHAHVLLMHGEWDMVIPVSNSQRLHEAAPGTTKLRILPGRGHLIAPLDLFGDVRRGAVGWFEAYSSTGVPSRT